MTVDIVEFVLKVKMNTFDKLIYKHLSVLPPIYDLLIYLSDSSIEDFHTFLHPQFLVGYLFLVPFIISNCRQELQRKRCEPLIAQKLLCLYRLWNLSLQEIPLRPPAVSQTDGIRRRNTLYTFPYIKVNNEKTQFCFLFSLATMQNQRMFETDIIM